MKIFPEFNFLINSIFNFRIPGVSENTPVPECTRPKFQPILEPSYNFAIGNIFRRPFFRAFHGHGPLTVVQIDAHIDWRDEVNGVTEGYSSTMRRASELPWIDRLIQMGMRGTGSARREEVEAAKAYGAELITAMEIQDRGVDWVLNLIPDGTACLVTIDCDGLDPSIMPAVNAPAPGGLTYRHVTNLLHGLSRKVKVVGFDLVELAPEKDVNELTAWTAARIIYNMIGALVRSKHVTHKDKGG